jgi:hypothetical protein
LDAGNEQCHLPNACIGPRLNATSRGVSPPISVLPGNYRLKVVPLLFDTLHACGTQWNFYTAIKSTAICNQHIGI